MCTPIALLAASTGMQLMGQRAQTKAQVAQYNAQAQEADMNKRLSDRKQEQIAEQYLLDRQKMSEKMRLVAGRNAAEAGASGLAMTGSALDLMGASYDEYNRDVRNWETNKNNDVYNEYLNGVNYQNQANSARAAASNAKTQGKLSMIGTILGAASSYANIKSQYRGATAEQTPSSGLRYVNGNNPYARSFVRDFRSGTMTVNNPYGLGGYSNSIRSGRY